jgi:hypothetical protein
MLHEPIHARCRRHSSTAVDCGMVVNPEIAVQQAQSAANVESGVPNRRQLISTQRLGLRETDTIAQ